MFLSQSVNMDSAKGFSPQVSWVSSSDKWGAYYHGDEDQLPSTCRGVVDIAHYSLCWCEQVPLWASLLNAFTVRERHSLPAVCLWGQSLQMCSWASLAFCLHWAIIGAAHHVSRPGLLFCTLWQIQISISRCASLGYFGMAIQRDFRHRNSFEKPSLSRGNFPL